MRTKSIFITGAASGIGRETALLFARRGWRVGLGDVNRAAVVKMAAEIAQDARAYGSDVLIPGDLAHALEDFCDADDRGLDALFNSAGILDMRSFCDTPLERQHLILDINVKGVLNALHAALPYLRRNGDARVVTMSSAAAIYGVPDQAVYSASKFAVRGLTEALSIELEACGIWVSDVAVTFVDTPMLRDAQARAKSLDILGVSITAAQVAETVWDAVAGRQVHWFVTPRDSDYAARMARLGTDEQRELMQKITGYR